MGANSNGGQGKGSASGKSGTQADSNGAGKKTSAPSVHDARKVNCPLISTWLDMGLGAGIERPRLRLQLSPIH